MRVIRAKRGHVIQCDDQEFEAIRYLIEQGGRTITATNVATLGQPLRSMLTRGRLAMADPLRIDLDHR